MRSLILFFLVTFLIISCHKDEIVFIPDQTFSINSDELLSKLVETPQSFQIILNNTRNIFIASDNIIIDIPEQSLQDESGQVVTGEIKMQFKEFSHKKSNLLYGPSSIFHNKVLNYSKIFYIKFSQNGKTLQIIKPIDVYLPSQDNNLNYLIYNAKKIDETFVWSKMMGESENVRNESWNLSYHDAQLNVKGFKVSVSGASNWHCIASQPEQQTKVIDVCLNTPSAFSKNNSLVYLVINDSNSSIKLEADGDSSSFCVQNILTNQKLDAKLIVISHLGNENYYFGMTNAVLDSSIDVAINPVKKNIKDIKEALNSL